MDKEMSAALVADLEKSEAMDDADADKEAVNHEAGVIVVRAPMKACTYLLRASQERLGCIEYQVDGHHEWVAFPLEYYRSRSKTSPFPQMWGCASLADRRRLIAEVREIEERDDEDLEDEGPDVIVLPNGVFLFPNRVPADMPHNERTAEEMRLWWGRPYIIENGRGEGPYIIQCLDGGAWDRPTYKGCAATVKEAIEIANKLLD